MNRTYKPTARQVLTYGLFVLGNCVLASRLAIVIHELLGHMLAAAMLGAELETVEIRPVGGGVSSYSYPAGTSPTVVLASTSAGLIANFVTGLAVLPLVQRWQNRPTLALFLTVFAGRSVVGALGYIALGLYHGVGDPGQISRTLFGYSGPSWDQLWLWIGPTACLPFAAYALTRIYATQQERWLPSSGPWSRLVHAGLTLGVAVVILFAAPRLINEHLTVTYEGAPIPLLPFVGLLIALGAGVAMLLRPAPSTAPPRPATVTQVGVALGIALLVVSALALTPVWCCS